MKLENQCCTSKQALILKELGIEQNCCAFKYVAEDAKTPYELVHTCGYSWHDYPGYRNYPYQKAAFTVAELGVLLGNAISVHKSIPGCNEAFDRAEDLIHLIEIGELLVECCNERILNS